MRSAPTKMRRPSRMRASFLVPERIMPAPLVCSVDPSYHGGQEVRAMDQGSAPYGGDEALARLLRAAGSPYDPAQVRELVAGVLAAPPSSWTVLVAPDPAPELVRQLTALAA